MIKLIASDMDGTLLDDNKELSPDFKKVYTDLRNAGIQFVVASGRPSYSLKPEFSFLQHDIIFICDNGAFIEANGEQIIVKPLEIKTVRAIIDDIRKTLGVNVILCSIDTSYIESNDEDFLQEARKYYKKIKFVDNLKSVEDTILKVAICDSKTWMKNSWPVWEKYQTQVGVAPSSDIWIDVMPHEVNKGEALNLIQKKFGITKEETMAFGDYFNDKEMLQQATHSYAMENAHPEIKKIARNIAPANYKDGVIKTIQKNVLGEANNKK
ncbi:HAD family hydrolase [Plebeiibacterium marinum]|uniref:Cof-type HAD-IIB family hydrolase n=1 Tax=Plebeiibacterium marinum TaxID=2992111 RepID=A0AAE3MCH1_9BACT|nr:HAD family hydrolase [Plebeiobacterium marinum]MCW3805271.1 Cof-type HAD-IIB family hydrolase [Plebeiobacterium marinum]